jgi:hypothetical protein
MMNLPQGPGPAEKARTVFGSDVARTADERPQDQDPQGREDTRDYTDDELIQEAREFLDYVDERESQNRLRAAELLRFCYRRGSQWPDKIRREREQDNRPCLEINMMPTFINQVTNDERQNRPACKIRPASSDATVEIAEIYQDLIRHIEYDSNAGAVYDNAYRYCVAANIGYWQLVTEYERENSFYQKILFKPVNNIFSVYYDPDVKEPDGSDAEKCLIVNEMKRYDFERAYPNAQPIDWQSTDPALSAWLNADSIKVADYFHKVYWKETLYLLPDGSTRFESEGPPQGQVVPMEWPPKQGMYIDKREVDRCEVRWEVVNGVEVLKRHDWAGKYIPVIPVYSDTVDIEGDVVRQALIDKAQDTQQMANYMVTKSAEGFSIQPMAPYVGAEGQFDQRERDWGQANTRPYPYLTYRKFGEDGRELGYGPPARSTADVDMTQTLAQAMQFFQFINRVTGVQDPLAQMDVDDRSGRAILAQERVANTQTFHFVDNLSRAIRYCGRQLVDLIPKIYDTQRVINLLREDGTSYKQTINQAQPQPPQMPGMPPQPPLPDLNDVRVGDYDVVVDTGPSYASKRAEAANSMMEMVKQTNGGLFSVAGDLLVKNMDWPGAEDVANRIQAGLPPAIQQLIAQKSQDPQVVAMGQALQQQQQQAQQQMQQMGQEMQKLQQQNQQLQTQVYQHQMKGAEKDLQLRLKDGEIQQSNTDNQVKMYDAQTKLLTQMMESKDVHAQIAQDMRESHATQFKLISEAMRNQEEGQIKRDELTLKTFQAIVDAIAKLGPQQGAQGVEVAEQETPRAERMVETGQAPKQQAMDLSPILQAQHELTATMGQGLAQHMGATQGLIERMADGHQKTLDTLASIATQGQGKPRRTRISKQPDGSFIGEDLEGEDNE